MVRRLLDTISVGGTAELDAEQERARAGNLIAQSIDSCLEPQREAPETRPAELSAECQAASPSNRQRVAWDDHRSTPDTDVPSSDDQVDASAQLEMGCDGEVV